MVLTLRMHDLVSDREYYSAKLIPRSLGSLLDADTHRRTAHACTLASNTWDRGAVGSLFLFHFFTQLSFYISIFLDYSTTQTLTIHAHSQPYKHTYTNPIPTNIFENWVGKFSRLTKSPHTPRCQRERRLPQMHNAVKSQNIRSHAESNSKPLVLPRLL